MDKATTDAVDVAKDALAKIRTGPQTSEFRLTVLIAALGAVLGILGAVRGNDHLVTIGGLMVAGPGAAYSIARGMAKPG